MIQQVFKNKKSKKNQLKFNYIKIRFLYLISGILVIFIMLFIALIFGPFFKIDKIEITKNDKNTNRTIAYNMIEKYRGQKLFKINKEKIKNDLLSYQENLSEIKIYKKYPNTLKIVLDSYKSIFLTKLNNKNYSITKNGVFIPSKSASGSLETINIFLNKNPKYPDYKKIIIEKDLKKINYLLEKIKQNLLEIKITEINFYNAEREVHFKTNNNTLFIFNLFGNLNEQFEKLAVFNKEKNLLIKPGIIYIDLRIKEKIFYCDTETEYQCYQNLKKIYQKK